MRMNAECCLTNVIEHVVHQNALFVLFGQTACYRTRMLYINTMLYILRN